LFQFLPLSLKPKVMEEAQNKLAVFQEKEIRRVWYKGEWWFSIVDVIEALTESPQPSRYWNELRARMQSESGNDELFANTEKLKMKSLDGKMRGTEAANTESMFRLIQSIPSPKAEPFKQWLAKVGYERIQEIENPELAAERARQYYQALGYSEDWIAKRLQSIEIRGKLTDEWKSRDVKEGLEYAILTAEISKATFGLTPSEYVKLKDLKRENLRDHMTDLELIFTMLGETATRNEAINRDAKGFIENKAAAQEGGAAAGDALEAFEKRTGAKVVTERNFKQQIAEAKKQKELGDGDGKS
jgi:hypothetical protein